MSLIWMSRSDFGKAFALTALLLMGLAPLAAQTPEIDAARAEAENGNPEALNGLGWALLAEFGDGIGQEEAIVHPALVEARELFRRAADLGYADAIMNLATMYSQGIGGPTDYDRSRELVYQAAEAGSSVANIQLSEWYQEGTTEIAADAEQARSYMLRAAETGNPYAQWRYAMVVLQGLGANPDPIEAWRWVALASDQGETNAMVSRGVMLATGEGVAEDDEAARLWYRNAAESGNIGFDQGLKSLGFMMYNGEGGPVDRVRGIGYLLASAAAGNEQAATLRDRYQEDMSDEEISQAFEIAQDWIDTFLPQEDADSTE